MSTIAFFTGCFVMLAIMPVKAQKNQHAYEVNLVSMKKDSAYKRLAVQLVGIMTDGSGKTTKYAEVKKLFAANQATLKRLKNRYNITGNENNDNSELGIMQATRLMPAIQKVKPITSRFVVFTGPFSSTYYLGQDVVRWKTKEEGPTFSWTTPATGQETMRKLGWSAFYFSESINVPEDPMIVAAKVEFHYSFINTGWDTENGKFACNLYVYAASTFNSSGYNALESVSISPGLMPGGIWKMAAPLSSKTFTSNDDFSFSKDATFVTEGYVTPGTTIYFHLGASYKNGQSRLGDFGGYHYGELTLKKIVIQYLRADD